MQNLPRIETMAQAREVLLEISGGQEITAELDEWQASIKKHNDQEFSDAFPEQETGTSASATPPTSCWSTEATTSTSASLDGVLVPGNG